MEFEILILDINLDIMPRASRKPIKKDIAKELDEQFTILVSSLSNSKDIELFFRDFLTEEEKTMLSKRLMLHLMLENGYRGSEIAAFLGISRETIRVHRNIWERGGDKYKDIIGKIAKREKAKDFWKTVERIIKPLEIVLNSKTNMQARAKLMSGELFDE